MKIMENGVYREATPEEMSAMERECARAEAAERKRPYTQEEVSRLLIARQINSLPVDDGTALRMKSYYPRWEDLIGETAEQSEYKFRHNGDLYKTIQPQHTFASQWVPGAGTESLYTRIDESHDGSEFDPIPYNGNMELLEGLYYTQDGITYRCTRSTGQPVYHALSELLGIYVEVVE
jgi:hypothetical protein